MLDWAFALQAIPRKDGEAEFSQDIVLDSPMLFCIVVHSLGTHLYRLCRDRSI
jgi:hypothetical protein